MAEVIGLSPRRQNELQNLLLRACVVAGDQEVERLAVDLVRNGPDGSEIPPAGKPFEVDFYTDAKCDDGQIVEENLMYDVVTFFETDRPQRVRLSQGGAGLRAAHTEASRLASLVIDSSHMGTRGTDRRSEGGARDEALELFERSAAGGEHDPATQRVGIFLSDGEVVFVFEGPAAAAAAFREYVNDPVSLDHAQPVAAAVRGAASSRP